MTWRAIYGRPSVAEKYPPCSRANARRFPYLFSTLTPGGQYFVGITELMRTYGARQVGTVYEAAAATQSYALGAMRRSEELGMNNSVEVMVVLNASVLTPVVADGATLGVAAVKKTVTAQDNAAAMRAVAALLRDLTTFLGRAWLEDVARHVFGTHFEPSFLELNGIL